MMIEPTYRGIPLSRITITTVVWTDDAADHIRTRTVRYAETEINLEPEWATEAALDPHRMLFIPKTGTSLGVVGWSVSARFVLKLWLRSIDLTAGDWNGASAAKANTSITNRYWRNR